jgi:dUTPase
MHKFIWKPARPKIFLINPVEWLPRKELSWPPVKQPGRVSYEIFAQREITIEPKREVTLEIGLGVRMIKGWCGLTLGQEILASGCVLRGEGIVDEKYVEDIVITIENESDSVVAIAAGDLLCIVYHTQRVRPA